MTSDGRQHPLLNSTSRRTPHPIPTRHLPTTPQIPPLHDRPLAAHAAAVPVIARVAATGESLDSQQAEGVAGEVGEVGAFGVGGVEVSGVRGGPQSEVPNDPDR